MSNNKQIFNDKLELFATNRFLSILADAVEEDVDRGVIPKDIKVGVEGDQVIKFFGNDFTVTCTRMVDDIFVVQLACSNVVREQLGQYATLEFIHKKLSAYFGTSAAQPSSDHNVNDMLKNAQLINGPTIFSAEHGQPIGLIASDHEDLQNALHRITMLEVEFDQKLEIFATAGFLDLLKTTFQLSDVQGLTVDTDAEGSVFFRWNTGEVHFIRDDKDSFLVEYYAPFGLHTKWREVTQVGFIYYGLMKVLRDLLPKTDTTLHLYERLNRITLAVPRSAVRDQLPGDTFLLLSSTPADEASYMENYMSTHVTADSNDNRSTTEVIGDAAANVADTVKSTIDTAADEIGKAGAAVNEALNDVMDEALKGPTFFERATQFTKDHARDVLIGVTAFGVGVAAGVFLKR